jgi:hypothetical protein
MGALTGLGQDESVALALEHLRADPPLQGPQLRGDGRLGNQQKVCRSGDAPFLDD